jgi:predicted RecA/RadA family phage recombinase
MARIAMPVQTGEVIDYTNLTDADIAVGDVVPLTTLCGVAETNIPDGTKGAVKITGVWDFPIAGGATIETGEFLYWDATAKKAVTSATGNTPLGVAVANKGSSATVVRAKIGFVIIPATPATPA